LAVHIVWDWNGTLFDDLELVVDSVNHGLARFGAAPIDLDGYRTHFTRPVKLFYDRLMGYELSQEDWLTLDRVFHDAYRQALVGARLTADAAEALQTVSDGGHTQSLLSMFPHSDLVPLVERLGIAGHFDRIDGLAEEGTPGDLKAGYLGRHLREMIDADDPAEVVVIGDTPDDAMAAFQVGVRAILYDGGSHHRHDLESTGVEVVPSLMEAVRSALTYRPAVR
jgi:phosphoglycolate phosphatase-like HAD superfamily hydrolase